MQSQHQQRPDTLIQKLSLGAYSIFTLLLIPLLVCQLLIRSVTRFSGYRFRIKERFGFMPKPSQSGGLLIHCVSVGEVVVACRLIESLFAINPDAVITVTTTTPTGSERLLQLLGKRVHHCYIPYDMPFAMKRLINCVQPSQVLVTEVELWPNLVNTCWQRQIPISIINARMTERSAERYKKIHLLFTPMLQKLSHICVQSQRDYEQYQRLGASEQQLTLTQNIKFDLTPPSLQKPLDIVGTHTLNQRVVFIAASTHDPEEEAVLGAFDSLKTQYPNLLLILVPRHPQRFDIVAKRISQYQVAKLSQSDVISDNTEILFGDTLGQLNQLYPLADFAFIGGSIAPKGGHNPLEACIHGIPCMMGSHVYNNPYICHTLAENGAITWVNTADDIAHCISQWINTPGLCQQQGQAGIKTIQENTGAVENTLRCLGLESPSI